VPERLRPVPKGHRTLAGGANHRCVTNINPSPGPGWRKSRDYIASPLPGLVVSCVRNRWFAPPANVRDASGVRYEVAVLRFRPEKPGTFVTVSTYTKRLASSFSSDVRRQTHALHMTPSDAGSNHLLSLPAGECNRSCLSSFHFPQSDRPSPKKCEKSSLLFSENLYISKLSDSLWASVMRPTYSEDSREC